MRSICLCFRVHHPFHFQLFNTSDVGSKKIYYDALRIENEINETAINCYLPSNDFILNLIHQYKEKFKVAFYISGTASDQLLMYEPDVITGFNKLAETHQVGFLGSTFSHSLITLTNHKKELIRQIRDHQAKSRFLFNVKPRVFVNSDLMYSDLIGKDIAEAGYKAVITNGTPKTLEWRSPNYVYSNYYRPDLNVYFRNEEISNSITHKLMNIHSEEDTDASEIFRKIESIPKDEPLLILYLEYQALGGIGLKYKHRFMENLIFQIQQSSDMEFILPYQIADRYGPIASIAAIEPICYVKNFHSSYFPGNELQMEAIRELYMLENMAIILDDVNLHKDWQYLQTSDHIHLMDDQHPMYQQDYEKRLFKTKYDAYANFMNILDDFRLKVHRAVNIKNKKQLRYTDKTGPSPKNTVSDRNNF